MILLVAWYPRPCTKASQGACYCGVDSRVWRWIYFLTDTWLMVCSSKWEYYCGRLMTFSANKYSELRRYCYCGSRCSVLNIPWAGIYLLWRIRHSTRQLYTTTSVYHCCNIIARQRNEASSFGHRLTWDEVMWRELRCTVTVKLKQSDRKSMRCIFLIGPQSERGPCSNCNWY